MPKFLAPACAVLQRLSLKAAFGLAGFLLVLPVLACALLASGLDAGELRTLVLAAAAVSGALGLYALAALHARMVTGVGRLVALTERISAGELVNSRDGATDDSDRAASIELQAAILKMSERLTEIVRQVRGSADSIASGARDIAEGNNHLSQRTQEQAASLEQTASGMEELAATAQQNAADCSRATQLAASASGVADKAAGQMRQLASTMAQIDDRSRRVGDILGTVEGIAFQTNILALNAAVEAARAGDKGRGFAVVAAEVRTLAQRSATAAREIKGLIGDSKASVEQGSKLASGAELTMKEVVGSVRQVNEVITAIAAATAEQSAGIESINEAIVQIDTANQQNAAMVEQATAATASFEEEAARLLEVVGRFKVDRGADRARVVAKVKEAAAHMDRVGKRRAFEDFNDRNGHFGRGEDYVFALDTVSGARLAYAPDHSVLGQNSFELTDADGRYFGRELIETARKQGFGWCDFKMPNPRTGRVEQKSVYVQLVQGVAVGCGIYRSTEEQGSRTDAARAPRLQPNSPAFPRLAAGHVR
jgi:methyl-accepting chemotaxis protein